MFDLLEFVYYVSSFWLFIFSPSYRKPVIEEWRQAGFFERFFKCIEVGVSIGCGFGVFVLIYWLLSD